VGEVAAVGEGQAHDLVAGLDHRGERGGVGLGAGVGLHIGELRAEQFLHAGDGQVLGDVDVLAAAVVAAARVALGILVRQDRALGFEHGAGGEVLGGDHLEGVALPGQFIAQDRRNLRVDLGQRGVCH
jgi:hypothetical protein